MHRRGAIALVLVAGLAAPTAAQGGGIGSRSGLVRGSAPGPRITMQSPLRWPGDPDWKLDYCNIERLSPEEIARRRADFDRQKATAQGLRDEAGVTRKDKKQA